MIDTLDTDAKRAFQRIAAKEGVSVEEVRKQIKLAMLTGMCNPDPKVQAYWKQIPHKGDVPTPEEVVVFLTKEVKNRRK